MRRGKGITKKALKQRKARAKAGLHSKELKQTQKLAVRIKSGNHTREQPLRRRVTTVQFKSLGPHVQSEPKRSTTSQSKSLASVTPSNISAPAIPTKSSTPVTPPVHPRALIEPSTISLPVQAQTQVPIQSAQAVTQTPHVAFRVFAICLATIAICVNFSNYSSLIPAMHSALHIDDGQVGLFSTLLFLGIILANVPGGILADRFGPRPTVLVALSCTTAGSLLFPVFPNFIWMVACRALIGLGAGAALVSCSFVCAQLGKYEPLGQGLHGGAVQLGIGLGLFSMTFLQELLGWRNALFVCGVLGIIALIVWLWYPKDVHSSNRDHHPPADNPALAVRTPAIWMLGLANMGTFGLADAIMAWISVYFIRQYGLPLAFAGALGSAAFFAGIILQPLGGLLLARLQKPVLLIRIGTVMGLLSVVALALPFHWFPLALVGLTLFAIGTTLPYAAVFSTASLVGKMSGAGAGISQAIVAILASLVAVTGAPLIGLVLESTSSFPVALGSIGLIFPTIAVTASLFLGFVLKSTKHKSLVLSHAQ